MDTNLQISAQPSRGRTIVYWVTTAILIIGALLGGASQLFHAQVQISTFEKLGYPLYLLTIIGACKMAGGIVLLLPRNPILKTAAYAGLFFIVTGATVSHVVQGDFISAINPLVVAAITLTSYWLSPNLSPVSTAAIPVSDNTSGQRKSNRTKKILYWTAIIILEFVLISGGAGQLFHIWGTVEGTVNQLGYPLYFLSIIGVWKIAGGIALLFPCFPRLQLWAYIGIFFEFIGASSSSLAMGLSSFHIITPLFFAGLTITALMLQRSFQNELPAILGWSPYRRYAA